MRRYVLTLALVLAACGPGVYTRAEVVYAEPAQYVYVEPVDRVVVVTREVLVARGYQVYRVEDDGPTRVIWARRGDERSEEHTSELQSLRHLVCRLLLEKKKDKQYMQ